MMVLSNGAVTVLAIPPAIALKFTLILV